MDNQNVVFEKVEKKSKAGLILAIISIAMAVLGGLGFGFVYFIWPTIVELVSLVIWPVFLLFYAPVLNLIPLAILGVVDIVVAWVGYLSIGVIVAAIAVSIVNLLFISKKGGNIPAIVAAAVSAFVLLAIVIVTVVNVILTVLGLAFVFGFMGLIYILTMLLGLMAV